MTKNFTVVLVLLAMLAPLSANANDALAAIMKKMGVDFKSIGAQISNSSANTSSLALAQDLAAQLVLAKQQTPDTVASGAQASADYQTQIGAIQTLVTNLITALQAGDNATATTILGNMKMDRDNSHDQFNPQTNEKRII